jgi:ADP-ribosylglycohydrolase
MDLRERFSGCLLGGAVGDALGAPVEFMNLCEIRDRFGIDGIQDFVPAYGRRGSITDDTQMTLFTAEGMIRSAMRILDRGLCATETVTGRAYHRWLITQGERSPVQDSLTEWPGWLFGHEELHKRRAPGNTCLSALRNAPDVDHPAENDSKGCGAVMRMAPVGLMGERLGWSYEETMRTGSRLGHLTHGHPSGYLSAGAFAVIVQALLRGVSLPEVAQVALDTLRGHEGHLEVSEALHRALALSTSATPSDKAIRTLGAGWVGEEALAIALYCALVASDLRTGVIMAVNIDGDSDSTGAIAGNLLGTMYGIKAIPSRWSEGVELREVPDSAVRAIPATSARLVSRSGHAAGRDSAPRE